MNHKTDHNYLPSSEREHRLIIRAQTGDKEAIVGLLTPYEQPIFNYLTSTLGNTHDAQDVTQDVFIKILKGLDKYQDRGVFKAWAFQIARNEALNYIRKRNRTSSSAISIYDKNLIDNELDDSPTAVESLQNKERQHNVHECIKNLPKAEKEVVTLRMSNDLTFREIANITTSSINTVLGRMRNASRKMKRCLELRGITSSKPPNQ